MQQVARCQLNAGRPLLRLSFLGWGVPAARMAAGTVPSAPAIGRSRLEASRERIVAGQRPIRHGDLAPPRDSELLAQDVGMRLGCSRGNAKALSNFVVGASRRDEFNDLALRL